MGLINKIGISIVAGGELGTPAPVLPNILSMVVEDAAPTKWVVTFNEAVTNVAATGWSAEIDAGAATISGVTGTGTTVLTFTTSETVANGEVLTMSYDGATGACTSVATTNELADITDQSVTNNVNVIAGAPTASNVVVVNNAGVYTVTYTYSGSDTEANKPPRLDEVTLSAADFFVGSVITATPVGFFSNNNRSEGTHTYVWYSSDDKKQTNEAVLSGETASTYTPIVADEGKYIRVAVTPYETGGAVGGVTVSSVYRVVSPALPAFADGFVEDMTDTVIAVAFDENVQATDGTGVTIEYATVGQTVNSVVYLNKVLYFTMAAAPTVGQAVTFAYDGLGNIQSYPVGDSVGAVTEQTLTNYVGATYSDSIGINGSAYASKGPTNWNDMGDELPNAGGPYLVSSDLDDLTGSATGVDLNITGFTSGFGNYGTALATTNFPTPVLNRAQEIKNVTQGDAAPDTVFTFTGFTANKVVRITVGSHSKSSGSETNNPITCNGNVNQLRYTKFVDDTEHEYQFTAKANASGDLLLTFALLDIVDAEFISIGGLKLEY